MTHGVGRGGSAYRDEDCPHNPKVVGSNPTPATIEIVRIIFPYNAKVLSGYQFHPSFEQATKYSGRQVRIWLAGSWNRLGRLRLLGDRVPSDELRLAAEPSAGAVTRVLYPSLFGARNHLHANRSLDFRFRVRA